MLSKNRRPVFKTCPKCHIEKSIREFVLRAKVCTACRMKDTGKTASALRSEGLEAQLAAHRLKKFGDPVERAKFKDRVYHEKKRLQRESARRAASAEIKKERDAERAALKVSMVDQELATRILARRRLLPFVQRFHKTYKAGWVHQDICRRLEKFSNAVAAGEAPRLLLLMPPRHGKSELASRKFPAWHLGKHPEHEIIATSHSVGLAMSFSRHIRDLLRDPAYQAIFSDCRLDPESQSVENWMTTGGGGYLAAGVGTGITGRGGHIVIVDDPFKDWMEADSATVRDSVWDWWMSTAYTRLAPGGGVLGIQTWWNDDDWAGRVQDAMATGDGDKYEVVSYPAINEGYDEYLDAEQHIIKVYQGQKPPADAVLTRASDSALHPERYTLPVLQQMKRNYHALGQGRIWSALYQQDPGSDDGNFFTRDMLQYYTHAPDQYQRFTYQAWDFAISTKNINDWTVGTTMIQDEYDNLYEVDLCRFKSDNSFVIVDTMLDFYEAWKPDLIGVEDGQIWKSIKAVFEKRCEERKLYPSYEVLVPLTDKMVRAGPLRGRMQMKKVWFAKDAPYRVEADKELLRFPAGKHDDIVDARAWCVRLTLTKAAPRLFVEPPPPSWKDKLRYNGDAEGLTHMAA